MNTEGTMDAYYTHEMPIMSRGASKNRTYQMEQGVNTGVYKQESTAPFSEP